MGEVKVGCFTLHGGAESHHGAEIDVQSLQKLGGRGGVFVPVRHAYSPSSRLRAAWETVRSLRAEEEN